MNPSWGFFNEFESKSLWFYCVVCYSKEPWLNLKVEETTGRFLYLRFTALFTVRCNKKHRVYQIFFILFWKDDLLTAGQG